LLALRTLEHLQHRIERVILLSPCVSRRALKWSMPRQWLFKASIMGMKNAALLSGIHRLMNTPQLETPLSCTLSRMGNIHRSILEQKNALHMPLSTLDVFTYTFEEILTTEYHYAHAPFATPCHFGMSIYDDLLDYDLTELIVRRQFQQITVQQFTLPYHQPPEPPTFEWLVREFGGFLDEVPETA
jgi:hypothetical protein